MKPNVERNEFVFSALHTLALFGMAVAQPLYDILGRYPEFLVVRDLSPAEILLLAGLLSLAAPGLLILAQWGARLWSPAFSRIFHRLVLALLAAALLLQPLKALPLGGAPLVALALTAAVLLTWAYSTHRTVRAFFHFLIPAAILFPLLFLLFSPVSELLKGDHEPRERWDIRTSTPIVVVVFDEFPTISLLDENQEIDEVLFPNFARLSREAHWFRNATTVNDSTLISISSIVTGLLPDIDQPKLPTLRDHPRNLFTLFESTHDLYVHEAMTRLAPPSSGTEDRGLLQTQSVLLSDLWLVYLHLLLPADLVTGLPRVTETWTDFRGHWRDLSAPEPVGGSTSGESPAGWEDFKVDWSLRAERFREFIASIQPSRRPFLHFFHSLLPHAGWEHLPDGRRYRLYAARGVRGVVGSNDRGEDPNRWLDDDWLLTQAYQAHLLQLQFVDKLVGELIEALRERGLYEETFLVITADHGAGFQAGDSRRAITPTNHPEILSIPLFMKIPFQREGITDDCNVEVIDILPTMVDVLGADPPWPMDGHSAVNRRAPERPTKVAVSAKRERFEFDAELPDRIDFVRRKIDLFGSRRPEAIFSVGPHPQLGGRTLDLIPVVDVPDGRFKVELEGEVFYRQVRTDGPFIPAGVTGRILNAPQGETPRYLAVSVNGQVRAVTRTSRFWDDNRAFTALVPPDSFREGSNLVDILLVSGSGDGIVFQRSPRSESGFRLEQITAEEAFLIGDRGDRVPIRSDEVTGWTAAGFNPSGDRLYVGGWAVDSRNRRPVRSIVVLLDGRSIAEASTHIPRNDAVEMFNAPDLLNSGFHFEFPPFALDPPERAGVRVFALSDSGVAGELNYPADLSSWPFKAPPTREVPVARPYSWGDRLEFGHDGNVLPHLVAGWGRPEDGIHWTVGEEAVLELTLPPVPEDVVLEVMLRPFLAPGKLDSQRVQIRIDRRKAGEWILASPGFQAKTLTLPRDLFERGGKVLIGLLTPDAASPDSLGEGSDRRRLGVALRYLSLRTADGSGPH
jgi:hypothetical protein